MNMLEKNRLDVIKARIDIMVKTMEHIDVSKLSNGSIVMFTAALSAISMLSSDLLHSYLWYTKNVNHNIKELEKLTSITELSEEMTVGMEKLLMFMKRLIKEAKERELLLEVV